jgi:hypothetical protein
MTKIYRFIFGFILFCFIAVIFKNLFALPTGIVGTTLKPNSGPFQGCICHGLDAYSNVHVQLNTPLSIRSSDTVTMSLTIKGGPDSAGGCDISSNLGKLLPSPIDSALRIDTSSTGNVELTHKQPKFKTGDSIKFYFRYIAPNTTSILFDTIYANGNSVDLDGSDENDNWNFAPNRSIIITPFVSVTEHNENTKSFSLSQNFPNPFNPVTSIKFNINKSQKVSLILYDINGRITADLLSDRFYLSGEHIYYLNAEDLKLTSGVYFYKLISADFSEVKKMILIK